MVDQGCRFGPESKPNPRDQLIDPCGGLFPNMYRGQICKLVDETKVERRAGISALQVQFLPNKGDSSSGWSHEKGSGSSEWEKFGRLGLPENEIILNTNQSVCILSIFGDGWAICRTYLKSLGEGFPLAICACKLPLWSIKFYFTSSGCEFPHGFSVSPGNLKWMGIFEKLDEICFKKSSNLLDWKLPLVGGWTNPSEKYFFKMGSSSPLFGVKIKNIGKTTT